MKTLIILLLISLSLVSQTFTDKTFNAEVFNSKLFRKINEYRKKNSIDTLIYSKIAEKLVTKTNVSKMVEKSMCYHPDVNFYDNNKIGEAICIDYYKKLNKKREYPEDDFINYAEISGWTNKSFKSYDEMAEYFLNGWLNSPKHHEILNVSFEVAYSGLCSAFVIKNKEGYFVTFNFFEISIFTVD
jgi:uncharacterized protein YkwD